MNSWYTYILVGLDTKIMFLLKVVAKLWPVFSNCKFHSSGQTLEISLHL